MSLLDAGLMRGADQRLNLHDIPETLVEITGLLKGENKLLREEFESQVK